MSKLQEVTRYVRSALDQHCVFVHMTVPQLETLLAGLEESQKRVEELEDLLDTISDRYPHYSNVYRKIQDVLMNKGSIYETSQ